jgi:hypothetical protein
MANKQRSKSFADLICKCGTRYADEISAINDIVVGDSAVSYPFKCPWSLVFPPFKLGKIDE